MALNPSKKIFAMSWHLSVFTLLTFLLISISAISQDVEDVHLNHGRKGFELSSDSGNYLMQIQARLQFRYVTPYDGSPRTYKQLTAPPTQVLKINRARLKVGGNAYKPYLKYYFEYELNRSALLDFRVMFEKWKWMKFKVGQWKIEYTRERLISSGKQQLVGRSILNRYFTLDRQQGVTIYGNVGNKRLANFSYWLAILTGAGRSATTNPTNDLMYHGRLQWNFMGKEMIMQGSDIPIHQEGIGSIALAGATYKGPYNLFSSAGGSDYYSPVIDSITPYYDVRQVNFETAYMYRGFSWQSETHIKEIKDESNLNSSATFAGTYLQAGYFFHQVFEKFPEKLEVAGRYAVFSPDLDAHDEFINEYSMGVNYFFNGHLNKISAEVTRFELGDEILQGAGRYRFRVQLDISF